MNSEVLVNLLIEADSLRFGSFVTKSGRQSPYFLDFGAICDGPSLSRLADLYAEVVMNKFQRCPDIVFGPAYKGIPLAVAVATALSRRANTRVAYAFDRKEAKDHGEGGRIVGRTPGKGDHVVIVDDVLTSGLSIRHSLDFLKPTECNVTGVCIGVDRCESGSTGKDETAGAGLEREYGVPVHAVATIQDVFEVILDGTTDIARHLSPEIKYRIEEYRAAFGK